TPGPRNRCLRQAGPIHFRVTFVLYELWKEHLCSPSAENRAIHVPTSPDKITCQLCEVSLVEDSFTGDITQTHLLRCEIFRRLFRRDVGGRDSPWRRENRRK